MQWAGRRQLIDSFVVAVESLRQFQFALNQELEDWKTSQRLALVGFPSEKKMEQLTNIGDCFAFLHDKNRELNDLLLWTIQGINNFPGNDPDAPTHLDALNNLQSLIYDLFYHLISNSLVVVDQEILVQKGNHINLEVALLIGKASHCTGPSSNPDLVVNLLTEEEARRMANCEGIPNKVGMNLVQNVTKLQRTPGLMLARFEHLKIEKVDQRGKKTSAQTEDYLGANTIDRCFVFMVEMTPFTEPSFGEVALATLSLPFVVRVNCNQNCLMKPRIIWRLAFGTTNYNMDRMSYNEANSLTNQVTWQQLAQVLYYTFLATKGITRPLGTADMHYLFAKLFGANRSVENGALITFEQVARFTFWRWFYEVAKLYASSPMNRYWNEAVCIGLLSKERAAELIDAASAPALLLRPSDSQLGAISVSCITTNGTLEHLTPTNKKDLELYSLADRIHTCPELRDTRLFLGQEGVEMGKQEVLERFPLTQPEINKRNGKGYTGTQIIMSIKRSDGSIDDHSSSDEAGGSNSDLSDLPTASSGSFGSSRGCM